MHLPQPHVLYMVKMADPILSDWCWSCEVYEVGLAYQTQNMQPQHTDIFLRRGFDYAKQVFRDGNTLTTEQIQFCLDSENPFLRVTALENKHCTEAQKVAYYLKWGK